MKKTILLFFILLCCAAIALYFLLPAKKHSIQWSEPVEYAAGYFRVSAADIRFPATVMLLSLMQEHFRHDFNLPHLSYYHKLNADINKSYLRFYDLYFEGREAPAFDSVFAVRLLNNLQSEEALNFFSAFCKNYRLPENFDIMLEVYAQQGDFETVLATFFAENALRSGCCNSKAAMEKLKTQLVEKLESAMNSEQAQQQDDLIRYGASAMLYYTGNGSKVSPQHIRYILDRQMANGGWSISSRRQQQSNELASLLALLTLMEYQSRQK